MKPFIRVASAVFIISLLVCGSVPPLRAQSAVGFNFLRTFVGARPSALAGAFVAIPGDIHNLVYNPAGLTGLSKRQGTLSYLNHLLDFQSGFAAYAQPLKNGTLAFGVHFFDFGQFDARDENNQDLGEFGASSVTVQASYARRLYKQLSLGLSAKYIRFQIENFSENAVAADIGLIFEIPEENWSLGLGVFNLGTTTSAFIETKDKLPLNVQFGVSKRLEHLPLLLSLSLVKYREESVDFRVGGEFTVTEQLRLRIGYDSVGQDRKVDTDKDRLAGVSLGLGLKIDTFDVDYSFSSFGEVGTLNRLTLVGRF